MKTKVTTYYIDENEDVIAYLLRNDIEISRSVLKQISFISNKIANNYIGFCQFKNKEEYVKFYIIPKIYKDLDDTEKERGFVKFLSTYYELSNKYSEINNVSVRGKVDDLVFEDSSQIDSVGINDLLQQKYEFALNRLDKFFRKHNKKQKVTTRFSSQTLNARIDLRKNVSSIDKSNIQQIKIEEQAYSVIASIVEQVLIHFQNEMLATITDDEKRRCKMELEDLSRSILTTIHKKYKTRQRGAFKDRDIISYKISKLFRKSSELLEIYEALLILVGLEHYKSAEHSSEIQKLPEIRALFFRPEDLYEWIVYDELKNNNKNAEVIFKDKKGYELLYENGKRARSSESDFVIIDTETVTIVDVKWNILYDVSNIKFEDIAKLERDYILRKDITENKEVKAKLVYPKIEFNPKDYTPMRHSYNENFEFEVGEIGVGK